VSKISEFVQQHAADPGPVIKAVNMVAAALGVSSFLGLVNLVVGVLSVGWLCLQAYGYIKYELPTKRARLLRAEFMTRSGPSADVTTDHGDLR